VAVIPDKYKDERQLITGTLSDLEDSIEELENRIEYMTDELKGKKERLATWRNRLARLGQGEDAERHRRPKGENLRAVINCLQGVVNGLATSEIQRRTKLAWSSIQATLKRNPDRFVEQDGLWRLRKAGIVAAAPPKGMFAQILNNELDLDTLDSGESESAPEFDDEGNEIE